MGMVGAAKVSNLEALRKNIICGSSTRLIPRARACCRHRHDLHYNRADEVGQAGPVRKHYRDAAGSRTRLRTVLSKSAATDYG